MIQSQTLFLLLLASIVAFGLSYIQYIYQAKTKRFYVYVLAFFRFLSYFVLLALLINPTITYKSWQTQKVVLPVLVDNSQSIKQLDSAFTKTNWKQYFANQTALNAKFKVVFYPFAKQLEAPQAEINFKGNETRIAQAATDLNEIYKNAFQPILLVTDGNQTQGPDYWHAFNPNAKIFSVIVGDTTAVFDIQLTQAHANKYVYVKNQFPIEIFANAITDKPVYVDLVITDEEKQVYKKTFLVTPDKNTLNELVYLTANSVGTKKYKIDLVANQPEKNRYNNSKTLLVNVVDQKTKIGLVSAIVHPDLGVLKRAIELHEQRQVSILKPNTSINVRDFDLLILYQPDASFSALWPKLQNANYWVITGAKTDYAWLNTNQSDFKFKQLLPKGQYNAEKAAAFNFFELPNLPVSNLPPLDFPIADFETNTPQTPALFLKRYGGVTAMPMLTFIETPHHKKAYWFGENMWKWRLETVQQNNYFDALIQQIIQYLTTIAPKQNLVVDIEDIYNETDDIKITAQYLNKNLEYDATAVLEAELLHKETNSSQKYNFDKTHNQSFLTLTALKAGTYQLKITEPKSATTVRKNFEVQSFNPELQAVQANARQLKILALQSQGKYFVAKDLDLALQSILNDPDYAPIQKEIQSNQELIDWRFVLGLVILFLAIEWIIRKYNGLQ